MKENSCPEFCEPENSNDTISKTLKVVNKPYKKIYVPGINIQGKYLNTFGFKLGDNVAVEVSANKILIEKVLEE